MTKRSWKIIYSNYNGIEKKAIEFLSAEMGSILNRDLGIYTLYVLPCEPVGTAIEQNAVLVGTYNENEAIRNLVSESEIPENGYLIKSVDHPEHPDYKLVIITARQAQNVFYACVDFIDDYLMDLAPVSGGLRTPSEVFDKKIPDFCYSSAPTVKTRSIFTWGHPINDYRKFIGNIARLKINQIIIWNDYLPVNAKDIVDFAHEYGIEVIWGYAWGWSTSCVKIDLNSLNKLKEEIIAEFLQHYDQSGDGIYFQSFTETEDEYIGNTLIAEAVTNFVNDVSDALLTLRPNLHIQFGLHALSIKNHMDFIAKVDKRVEIVWEDCGTFPYHYMPVIQDEADFEATMKFTDEILYLRPGSSNGLVYKGMMTMDWSKFSNQSGPYIMGVSNEQLKQNDIAMLKPIWKSFQGEWMRYGKYVHILTKSVVEQTKGDINLCIAGALDGGIWFPEALCAQIMWNSTQPYEEILEKVGKRQNVIMA